MSNQPLAQVVDAAKRHEPEAFAELVARFQDMAVGRALGGLADPDLARDAAQEAFTEAFLKLHQLRESAAFPGWFGRIVLKQCDRIRRRLPAGTTSMSAAADLSDTTSAPSDAFDRRLDDALVRRAIETLPEHERSVVALYYLSGESQDDIAALLDITAGGVKKRLHSARGRLREEMQTMWTEPLDRLRPSNDRRFSRTIQLFVAVRTGDRKAAARLLDEDASLVDLHEDWDIDEAIERALPVPNRATPLIRAAERDDVEMVDLLLDRGAAVAGDCGCETRESPLWAALVTEAERAAERLLERGADPNGPAANGTTPLHVAAIRDLPGIAATLLSFGADIQQTDARGRTALDWAKEKGHHEVADVLTQAAAGVRPDVDTAAELRSQEDSASLVEGADPALAAPLPVPGVWATGIKALDLFAPLEPGTTVDCGGRYGVGRNVFLAELSARAALAAHGSAVWGVWEHNAWDDSDLSQLLAETGLREVVHVVRASADAPNAERRSVAARAMDRALAGATPSLLVLFAEQGHAADIEAVLGKVASPLICVVVAPWQAAEREASPPLPSPFRARIAFDPVLAAAKLFPAIDPIATTTLTAGGSAEHRRRAQEARALLAGARTLDPAWRRDLVGCSPAERNQLERARRLQAFLTQPFLTTESFVGDVGRSLSLDATLFGVSEILDGRCDDMEPVHFLYRGDLEDVRRQAGNH